MVSAPIDRVLFFDIQVPRPDRNASSVRTRQMLEMLRSRGFAVDLATLAAPQDDEHRRDLDALGVETLPWRDEEGWRAYLHHHGRDYGLMLLAWSAVARRFMSDARAGAPAAVIVYDTQDVNHLREYREAKVTGNAQTLRRAFATRAAELEAMRVADGTIAITEADAETFRALCPTARVETVSMWVDTPQIVPRPAAPVPAILYLGNYGTPINQDAALLLAREILPRVAERVPAARLILAGADADAAIRALASDRVEVPGWLPDLADIVGRSAVFAAPLRFGSGLKGKLLQAMAHGVPVVASRVAAEGLGAADGLDLLLAEGPAETAAAIGRILEAPMLGRTLADGAFALLGAHFTRATVAAQFDRLLSTVRVRPPLAI